MSVIQTGTTPSPRSIRRSLSGEGMATMRPIHALLGAAAVACPLAALAGSLVR